MPPCSFRLPFRLQPHHPSVQQPFRSCFSSLSCIRAPARTRAAAAMATTSAAPAQFTPVSELAPGTATVQKRFAPLKGRAPGQPVPPTPTLDPAEAHHHTKVLRGVVFDVDGTLCLPQNYMFGQMREALGITTATDILDHIYSLPTPAAQDEAMERVRAIERRAMALQTPQPGLAPLMAYLDARGVPKGICTRNFDTPVQHLLTTFLDGHVFHPIVTRDFRPPKPDPAGILHIARSWGFVRTAAAAEDGDDDSSADPAVVQKEQHEEEEVERKAASAAAAAPTPPVVPEADASGLIMVGDSIDDMTAGRRAGAATVLLVNDANRHLSDHPDTDLVIAQLDDLIDVLENGFVGREVPQQTR